MTASEILELVRAGYSRAEIDAMQQTEQQQTEQQQTEQQQTEQQQTEQQQTEQQQTEQRQTEQRQTEQQPPDWAAKLNESINNLIGAVQKINRDSLEQPDDDPNKQVDEALAAYLGKKK